MPSLWLQVCAIVPGWNNDCPLLDRLFRIFAAQPSVGEGRSESDCGSAPSTPGGAGGAGGAGTAGGAGGGEPLTPGGRTPLRGRRRELLQTPVGAAARAAAALAADLDSAAGKAGGSPFLWFDQLVCGLGWLLRGDSERRGQLCFACFDVEG